MKAKCFAKSHRSDDKNGNETRYAISDNRVFRADRITPEFIMSIRENCGKSHMIEANLEKSRIYLKSWNSEV